MVRRLIAIAMVLILILPVLCWRHGGEDDQCG